MGPYSLTEMEAKNAKKPSYISTADRITETLVLNQCQVVIFLKLRKKHKQ